MIGLQDMIILQEGKFPDNARLLYHKKKDNFGYVSYLSEYHKNNIHQLRGRVLHFQYQYLNYDTYKIDWDFEGEHIKYL